MKPLTIILAVLIILIVAVSVIIYFNYEKGEIGEGGEETSNACTDLGCSADTQYVGSKNSDKYYTCDCHYAKRINPENIICFKDDEDALADGREKSEC